LYEIRKGDMAKKKRARGEMGRGRNRGRELGGRAEKKRRGRKKQWIRKGIVRWGG
jgi:hypothetical protein